MTVATKKRVAVGVLLLITALLVYPIGEYAYILYTYRSELPKPWWMVPRADQAAIVQACGIANDEPVQWFFALDFFSNLEDACFFTDKTVVSYSDLTDAKTIRRARFEDIKSIYFDDKYVWYNQAKLIVETKDNRVFYLLLLKTLDGHKFFSDRLYREWSRHR